jgi:hypothetical protein
MNPMDLTGVNVTFQSEANMLIKGTVIGYTEKDHVPVVEVHPNYRHLIHTHGGLGLFDCPNQYCRFVHQDALTIEKSEMIRLFMEKL